MKLNFWLLAIFCLILLAGPVHALTSKDYANTVSIFLFNDSATDYDKAIILMNYSYMHIPGACTQKSNGFEFLARNSGLRVQHIVLICGIDDLGVVICSHATSRVWLNNSWVYFDSLYNKIRTFEDYSIMGYYRMIRHINCIDYLCSNYNFFEKTLMYFFYIKVIDDFEQFSGGSAKLSVLPVATSISSGGLQSLKVQPAYAKLNEGD